MSDLVICSKSKFVKFLSSDKQKCQQNTKRKASISDTFAGSKMRVQLASPGADLGAVYTCDFPYESPYDSVYDSLPKVSGKIIFDFFC
jgi:hypothetical protein